MAPKRWSLVEFGALAYVLYSSVGAVVVGAMFLIVGSVMSAIHVGASRQGLGIDAPSVGHVVQFIGGVLLFVGIVAGAACGVYVIRQRARGAISSDDQVTLANGSDPTNLGGVELGVTARAHLRRRVMELFNNRGSGQARIGGPPPSA
ncbi:MAG: hypothetical protein ACHREM_26400 [Polyangiales bacterium]